MVNRSAYTDNVHDFHIVLQYITGGIALIKDNEII
jgi:hypothetical protein